VCQHLDAQANTRKCAGKAVLLLLDEEARAFPCYGAWRYQERNRFTEKQGTIKAAYRERRFRNLCVECGFGIKKTFDGWFPCSRFGCTPKTEIWAGHRFEHLQFGDRNNHCESYVPCFELSLENARVMLYKFLYPDFWRTVLVDPNPRFSLDHFWPVSVSKKEQNLPLFGEYSYGLDTAVSLKTIPAVSSYLHDPSVVEECRDMFLPVSMIPHLRVMFFKHIEILLVSIILSDRRNLQTNYRSVYRDDPAITPESMKDPVWLKVWRLPNNCKPSEWNRFILDVPSSLRSSQGVLSEPGEFIALLDSHAPFGHTFGKEVITLYPLFQYESIGSIISKRSEALRQDIKAGKNPMEQFLSVSNPDHGQLGELAWTIGKGVSSLAKHLYFREGENSWKQCFDEQTDSVARSAIGCRLVNYLIWLRAVFGEKLLAFETFNSNTIEAKQPSQFVVYSQKVLDSDARSQFKLTLISFMQPIENAYAQDDEIQKRVGNVRKIAFQNTGHTMRNRSESVGLYFKDDFEPDWFKKYKSDVVKHGYPLDSLTAEQRAYRRSWIASRTFPRTCMILELWRFDSPASFWWGWEANPQKKSRFFSYDSEPVPLNEKLKEWSSIATITKKVSFDNRFLMLDSYLRLVMYPGMTIMMHSEIFDPEQRMNCQLDTNVIAALFFEVFRNIASYGLANALSEDDISHNRAIIEAAVTSA